MDCHSASQLIQPQKVRSQSSGRLCRYFRVIALYFCSVERIKNTYRREVKRLLKAHGGVEQQCDTPGHKQPQQGQADDRNTKAHHSESHCGNACPPKHLPNAPVPGVSALRCPSPDAELERQRPVGAAGDSRAHQDTHRYDTLQGPRIAQTPPPPVRHSTPPIAPARCASGSASNERRAKHSAKLPQRTDNAQNSDLASVSSPSQASADVSRGAAAVSMCLPATARSCICKRCSWAETTKYVGSPYTVSWAGVNHCKWSAQQQSAALLDIKSLRQRLCTV